MKISAKKKNILSKLSLSLPKLSLALLLLVIFGLFFAFSYASALETNWPASPLGTSLDSDSTLPILIKYVYEWGIALGGLAAFIALIIAGFQYLTSMGDPTQMKEALDRIRSAFLGIILLLSSLLILNTINPDLTSLRTDLLSHGEPPGITIPGLPIVPEKFVVVIDCEKITVTYTKETTEETIEETIDLLKNECKNVPIGTRLKSSIGTPSNCMGYLEIFSNIGCVDLIKTLYANNTSIAIDRQDVRSLNFFVPTPGP